MGSLDRRLTIVDVDKVRFQVWPKVLICNTGERLNENLKIRIRIGKGDELNDALEVNKLVDVADSVWVRWKGAVWHEMRHELEVD